ncbi:MAG: hypothetical protein JJLCMIEE_03336 [Acidimicrobiales bacterium]|nr:MAG: AI-2E family transporter [Actinomycetota bacterium]MBV6510206.1 hypothetical protein [Acidimicrobiales bacterium]RIK03532.1 MAG: AI-2E family transporter [Acidobacteriota bacterium]
MAGADDPDASGGANAHDGDAEPVEVAVGDPEEGSGADGSTAIRLVRDREALPHWVVRAILYALVGVTVLAVVWWLFQRISDLLVLLLISLFASFAMEPAVNFMASRGWRRGPATALVFFVFIIATGLFLFVIVDLVIGQVSHLVAQAPSYINTVTDWINDQFNTDINSGNLDEQFENYQDELQNLAKSLGGRVLSLTTQVVGVLFQSLTILLFTFYFVADGPKFRRTLCSRLRPDRQRVVLAVWELAIQKTGGYIYSRLLLALLSGLSAWIVFAVMEIPSPLALAMWLGLVSQFVPVIGTYLAGAVPVLVALINDPIDALVVVIFILVYQQIENYFFAPRITARTMEIHPAVAFGAVIAGASILGPIGAILALPAAAIIQAFGSTYLHRHDVVESALISQEPLPSEVEDEDLERVRMNLSDRLAEAIRRTRRRTR